MAVQTKLQVRRDTATNWTTANPTLASGEIGFETDTLKFKIGNGSTAWTSLKYSQDASLLTGNASITTLSTTGDINTAGKLNVTASAGDEGGEIFLAKAAANTSINTGVNIDIYQNKLRFWESGGTNRGYYVDITSGGAGAGTSLTGGSTGAMNYAQTIGTKQSAISTAGTSIVSVSITTNGYPIQVVVTGDVENNSAGGWVVLQLYRGSTAIGNPVHAESSAGSENVPYALSVIDAPSAGTYTYALKLNNSAGGTFNFGESNGPVITAIELSGPKGDTGAAGPTFNGGTITNALTVSNTINTTSQFTSTFAGAPFVVSNTTVVANLNADLLDGYNTASTSTANTVVVRDASQNFSANTITANLFGTANLATYVVGGVAGSIPYQNAPNTTTFLAAPATNNSVLTYNTSTGAPEWDTPPMTMATLMGYTSTVTAAGVTSLTNASTYYQQFTGTTTQTVILPNTATLIQGWTFHIVNNSTANVTANTFSNTATVITIPAGTTAMVTCIDIVANTAAAWEVGLTDFSSYFGSGSVVLSPTDTSGALKYLTENYR